MEAENLVYRISEIFYSVQGEGLKQGLPMVFIRLAGCNLHCRFCDTKYALKGGREKGVAEILRAAGRYRCRRVCITGGEPFLQNLSSLVKCLKRESYWVSAETSGTLWQRLPLDWLTVSPKQEGLRYHPHGYDRRFMKTASEFKYVISSARDMGFIDRKIKNPVILQPADNRISTAKEIIRFLKKRPEENWYLRMQMHKIAGVR